MAQKSIEVVPPKQAVIYKLSQTKNWYCRIKYVDQAGYWKGTTGTPDIEKAKIKAIELNLMINSSNNEISQLFRNHKATVEAVAKEFLKKDTINKNDKTIVENYIIPKIGKQVFSKLKYSDIEEYIKSCNIKSESTFANHKATLSKLFRFAVQNEFIESTEHLSLDKKEFKNNFLKKETDVITPSEYKNMMVMKNQGPFIFNVRKEKSKQIRTRLMSMIFIILSTGIRPGNEIEEIEFRDLRFEEHKEKLVGFLKIRSGKVSKKHQREIPLNNIAAEKFAAMIGPKSKDPKYLNELIKQSPNHRPFYVDGKRPEYARNFSRFVDICKGNKAIAEEKNITLYSFRHSYITTQLKQKRDIYALAKYCGTSVKMIEDFYSKYKSVIESESIFDQPFTFK